MLWMSLDITKGFVFSVGKIQILMWQMLTCHFASRQSMRFADRGREMNVFTNWKPQSPLLILSKFCTEVGQHNGGRLQLASRPHGLVKARLAPQGTGLAAAAWRSRMYRVRYLRGWHTRNPLGYGAPWEQTQMQGIFLVWDMELHGSRHRCRAYSMFGPRKKGSSAATCECRLDRDWVHRSARGTWYKSL